MLRKRNKKPNRTTTDYSYGAFTVGAEVFQGKKRVARLELDLAELKDAPMEFRTR
ncbi:MAG: hypothetical protein ABSG52_10025 [Terriglobales bacterium]